LLLAAGVAWGSCAVAAPTPLLAGVDPLIVPLAAAVRGWTESREIWGPLQLGLVAALALWLWRSRARTAVAEPPLQPTAELLGWLACTAVFLLFSMRRLDVYPALEVDEVAYFTAARMQIGELARGEVLRLGMGGSLVYDFPRFAAQPVPHGLMSATLALGGSRIVQARLLSVLLAGGALLAGAACVRARWGARAGLATLAFASTAPLLLAYAQRAYYVAASELHAVACFALLLYFERRRSVATGVALGALLGASVSFYQLSWFVPVLCGLCVLATPSLWRAAPRAPLAALGVTTAAVSLAVALWLAPGLRLVYAQSVDKLELAAPEGVEASALLLARGRAAADAGDAAQRLRDAGMRAESSAIGARSAALLLGGTRAEVTGAVGALRGAGWRDAWSADDGWPARARRMLEQLAIGPAPQQIGAWVLGPVLNPWVAPLVLAGMVLAWTRWRADLLARWLSLWVAGALLLPALVASPLPRRALLAVPFACALAARVALDLTHGIRARAAVTLARVAGALLVASTGAALYAGTWVSTSHPGVPELSALDLEDVLRARPPGVLLATGDVVAHARELESLGLTEHRLQRAPGVGNASQVRRVSCRHQPPFTWLAADTPAQRQAFEALAADHALSRAGSGALLVVDVASRSPSACELRAAH
jgi:hypothetical protein